MGAAPPDRSALEDEDVLVSIERSFAKFHAFLDLVNDAGWVTPIPAVSVPKVLRHSFCITLTCHFVNRSFGMFF